MVAIVSKLAIAALEPNRGLFLHKLDVLKIPAFAVGGHKEIGLHFGEVDVHKQVDQ